MHTVLWILAVLLVLAGLIASSFRVAGAGAGLRRPAHGRMDRRVRESGLAAAHGARRADSAFIYRRPHGNGGGSEEGRGEQTGRHRRRDWKPSSASSSASSGSSRAVHPALRRESSWRTRTWSRRGRLGTERFSGLVLGAAMKIALALAMIGVFVTAYLVE